MGLQARMYLLVGLMFAILYAVITGIGSAFVGGSLVIYAILALFFVGIQWMIGPAMVGWMMKIKWVSEREEPELHQMVAELAQSARIPKPRVGISQVPIPNAFAFGRTQGDARVCVTEGIRRLLNRDELRAVLGHEVSHIKHRDMTLMTLLSVLPLIIYFMAFSLIWSGGGRGRGSYGPLIGIGLFIVYFFFQLLVLYGSRIREYYADLGSVRLGNRPRHMATALYKLVAGSARVPKEALGRAEGMKAFFVNDPSRALREVSELKEIDQDMSGTIDRDELTALRTKTVRLGTSAKIMEALSTHPNMLKRIKHLSSLVDTY